MIFTDFDFWQVHQGQGRLTLDGTSFRIAPGSTFIFCPGMKLIGEQDSGALLEVFACHFYATKAERKSNWQTLFKPYQGHRVSNLSLFRTWSEQAIQTYHPSDSIRHEQAQHLLRLMLLQLHRERYAPPASPQDSKIHALIQAIQKHPAHNWSIQHMCRHTALSSTYLNQRMLAITGYTPNRFVIQTKVERAQSLLQDSTMNLDEIADTLGYRDIYFFNRQFKQIIRQSPGQFRKNNRL